MNEKIQGIVKWFDEAKGFGFIVANGKDYFVHYSAIQTEGFKTLYDGQCVFFNEIKSSKGYQADCVTIS